MLTDAQLASNRANAQLSTGPKTEEGKARFSQNATRHGLYSTKLLLPHEDAQTLATLRRSYEHRLRPTDELEQSCVEEMVASTWKQQRLAAYETSLQQAAAERLFHRDKRAWAKLDPDMQAALAWQSLADTPSYALLLRQQASLARQHDRALKRLQLLRSGKLDAPSQPRQPNLQNEPAPVNTQPEPEAPVPVTETPNEPAAMPPLPGVPEPAPQQAPVPDTLSRALRRAA